MAMYHFRIKSDKKPNGTKISAVKHVEYINREGTFAHDEQWKETNKFVGNFITTKDTPNALDGVNALLYKTDDFGSIKNSERGIEVTENFSHTTIAIALMLADEAMGHKPLVIHGSPDFHKAVLQTALLANLPISFQDKLMQNEFNRQREDRENERNRFVLRGGKIITKRPNHRIRTCHAKTIAEATKAGFHLPTLSNLQSLHSNSEGVKIDENEARNIEEFLQESYKRVRFDFSSEQKNLAHLTAKKILENMSESISKQSAVSHVEYINREKAFEKRGGCIFQFHRLPKWAHDDPKNFFQAADIYEGKGNR